MAKTTATEHVTIKPLNFGRVKVTIVGTSPYCQARFGEKARQQMEDKMTLGSQATKGKKREARNFERDYEEAQHISNEGWNGMPASAFRNAMISACRVGGYKMTMAKMSVFVEADGVDRKDKTPLVKIIGKPEMHKAIARNANGQPDIRIRPLWEHWKVDLNITFDADQFSVSDVINLLARAGVQVGVGEGRPDSKASAGIGWGTFMVEASGNGDGTTPKKRGRKPKAS